MEPQASNTFRPKHKIAKQTPQYELYKTAKKWKSLGIGATLRDAVVLPEGAELEDWVAVNGT